MGRLHLLVEGQTEEAIADAVLRPHLESTGWLVSVSLLTTKRPAGGGKYSGGVSGWNQIRRELVLLLRSRFEVVTTVLDFYGFPRDAPGMGEQRPGDPYQRVANIERAIAEEVADHLVPHLTLHETEAWVFAAAEHLAALTGDAALAADLGAVAKQAGGPEMVNDGPQTAPSKRLLARLPTYQKTLHGPLSVKALGLAALRAQCPHLDAWLRNLDGRLPRQS